MGRVRRKRKRAIARRSDITVGEAHSVHSTIGELAQFCLSHGCSNIKSLRPYNFKDSGRGLQTLSPIHPGDTLIALPRSLLITTSVALRVEELKRAVDISVLKPTAVQLLSAFLLFEKNKGSNSYWYQYMQSLPETFTTLLYMNSADVDVLDDKLSKKYHLMTSKVASSFDDTNSIFGWSIGPVLYEDFLWAWHVTNTRCVFMAQPTLTEVRTTPDDLDNFALAPFLDLLNHSPSAQAEYGYNKEKDCFQIVSNERYNKYDQVYIPYSSHSNRALLLEYGFCIPGNVDDCIEFDFEEVTDLLIPERPKICEQLVNAQLNCGFLCDGEGLSWNLLEAMRVLSEASDVEHTEQKCRELLLSAAADKRLICLSKISTCLAESKLQRSVDELFILDMLSVMYKNEVTLLLNAVSIERSKPEDVQTLEHTWEYLCDMSIE